MNRTPSKSGQDQCSVIGALSSGSGRRRACLTEQFLSRMAGSITVYMDTVGQRMMVLALSGDKPKRRLRRTRPPEAARRAADQFGQAGI